MDKYRRNDDANDDLEVYNHEEPYGTYNGMTIFDSNNGNQPLNVQGHSDEEIELITKLSLMISKLSKREKQIAELIAYSGMSIRQAAKKLNISQPMAQKYWNRIKTKMSI